MPGPKVYLASPRSFCAGVVRAIDIVRTAIDVFGKPIYVRHAIVHNRKVVDDLTEVGAITIEDLTEVPSGSTVIFSAHGVSPLVRREAESLGLRVIDATCPLVAKVHIEVMRLAHDGHTIVLVGHRKHVEVVGTFGEAPDSIIVVETIDDVQRLPEVIEKIAYVTQTTLSVDDTAEIIAALTARYPNVVAPRKEDICYATTNRQGAVKQLAQVSHVILVVSSPESSNGTRLVEVAQASGCRAYMVDKPEDIDPRWLNGDVGITAAASTPESTVQACALRVCELGGHTIEVLTGTPEEIHFVLPPVLRNSRAAKPT